MHIDDCTPIFFRISHYTMIFILKKWSRKVWSLVSFFYFLQYSACAFTETFTIYTTAVLRSRCFFDRLQLRLQVLFFHRLQLRLLLI